MENVLVAPIDHRPTDKLQSHFANVQQRTDNNEKLFSVLAAFFFSFLDFVVKKTLTQGADSKK